MRKNKYLFVLCMLLAISLAGGIFTKIYAKLEDGGGDRKLRIVTSFYPVYIAALNVVGDSGSVQLENLSEPQTGCLHDYQLTPQDMILLSKADLFLVNGGGIEGFLAKVGESYPDLLIAETTEGIELLEESEGSHSHEESQEEGTDAHSPGEAQEEGTDAHGPREAQEENMNAHGWMDTRVYIKMVENIAGAISVIDPKNEAVYQENAKAYCGKVQELSDQISEIEAFLSENSAQSPNVVILHEAYDYVAEQYGMHTAYCLNLDEERQVSAKEVADVLGEIAEHQVKVVFAEELYGKDLGNAIEAEADCTVCYLDALIRGDYRPNSYLSAMQHNIDQIKQAFAIE